MVVHLLLLKTKHENHFSHVIGVYTLQPHYNIPHYNAIFNIIRPCHGSQIDYFTICLKQVTSL